MKETFRIEFDGGSRGNPGPAGAGAVVRAADGTPVVTAGRYIGKATNNVAEYRALILGLSKARELKIERIAVFGDSELIVKQMRGEYRVKHPDLRPLYEKARALFEEFEQAEIRHNLREHNTLADTLANRAIDKRGDVDDADDDGPPPGGGLGGGGGFGEQSRAGARRPAPGTARLIAAGGRAVCPVCGASVEVVQAAAPRDGAHPIRCQCGEPMNMKSEGLA